MPERTRLRKELLKNTGLFFVVFALIFAVLGVFVYQTVSSNLFRSVDEQLGALQTEEYEAAANASQPSYSIGIESQYENDVQDATVVTDALDEDLRTLSILRDESGAVVDSLGIYSHYRDLVDSIPFDKDVMDKPYLASSEGHTYRAMNYRCVTADDGAAFLQLVINVDSEMAILNGFTQTLVTGLVAALLVSAAASYALSRKTLKPIAEAWGKQTEFVQNASHELRTPLTVIKTTQELLLEHPEDRIIDRFEDISLTIAETGRLARLAKELLDLTALDSEASGLEKQDVHLDEMLASIGSAYEELADMQGKTLSFALESDATIRADGDKLSQLLAIVLDNALKYTEEGDAIAVATQARKDGACITVSDTGVGIEADEASRVFDRFYRADQARSRETGGNGLGLSIARGIVDAHGGTIRLDPNQGHGVTVSITLPR